MAKPIVIAHRGGAKEAPENTLTAFRHAIEIGVPFLECDVRFTKDEVPIVIHDETTKRHWKGVRLPVSALTLDQIKKLVGKGRFLGEKIPTFEEFLEETHGKIGLMIELKEEGIASFSLFVEKVLEKLPQKKSVYLGSFSSEILMEIKKRAPEQPLIFIADRRKELAHIPEIAPQIVAIHYSLVKKSFVEEMHAKGIQVWVWTVNNVTQMQRLTLLGIDGVITDRPLAMKAALQ